MKKKTIPAKKLHAYIRAAIQVVFFICFPSAFTTAFSAIKSFYTDWQSSTDCMEFVPDSLLGTLCLYNCIWTVFLWLCLCIWFIGRCRSKSLCFHLQKMQEEANYLETEKIAITFPEIRRFVGCRISLLYRCIQRFKGLESVGCLFHAASRKYSSGRLLARYPLIRWHSCRHGTL